MVCNIQKFEELRRGKNISWEMLAKDAGMNCTALYKRISMGGIDLTIKEAARIKDALEMTDEEAVNIFFPKKSQK